MAFPACKFLPYARLHALLADIIEHERAQPVTPMVVTLRNRNTERDNRNMFAKSYLFVPSGCEGCTQKPLVDRIEKYSANQSLKFGVFKHHLSNFCWFAPQHRWDR